MGEKWKMRERELVLGGEVEQARDPSLSFEVQFPSRDISGR